jgi:tryptophanase
VIQPIGGHAVFIDGRRFFPKVPEDQFPAQLLCVEMYREGAVRPIECGANLAGRDPDTGENVRPALDLARLAIPRRVYNNEHLDYVVDVVKTIKEEQGDRRTGLAIATEQSGIRHFTTTFRYVQN